MEKTITKQSSENSITKKGIWDYGSSLYDSFELKSFEKQLDSAIASSRTLSTPHLSDNRCHHPPENKKPKSKLPRSFHRLIRSVFRLKINNNSSNNFGGKEGFYAGSPALSTIPEVPELDGFSPEIRRSSFITRLFTSRLNESKRPELEKASHDRTSSQQTSVIDAAVATEIGVPLKEVSNGCASLDSVETSKKDEHPKVNEGGESFFAGLIKKGFRYFKKSNQDADVGGPQVFVNGHFIPDRVVKKAEKLAGPIQPGEYWYDKKAGFWGVMDHPCLGIIMPNIEEFNYPMPKNCTAGNTGFFVNGRELHQKDLDLLANRGLPITRHRSYLIEISGKVIDEQTGEELDGLGKLAPTVEKAKHGFGMKVPRFIAQLQS